MCDILAFSTVEMMRVNNLKFIGNMVTLDWKTDLYIKPHPLMLG